LNVVNGSNLDLSIICVSWNTASLLANCLRSIAAGVVGLSYEVIVVDNASTDGTRDRVKVEFPDVILLNNDENIGFARANNQGIRHSHGRYILLLNSDTVVKPGTLTTLVRFMEAHPRVAVVSPRLLRLDGTPQPYAFGNDPTLPYLIGRALNHFLFRRYPHNWATDQVRKVDWVSGACLLARRQAIEEVGLLDDNIFMYFEDADWCLRFRKLGWIIYYHPEVEITHLGGQSLKKNPQARHLYHQSLRYFYAKHYSRFSSIILRGLLKIYTPRG
jgi:N-acetylglucosaminyl-diphospho-decaprenol L-rhamnosyltransferase